MKKSSRLSFKGTIATVGVVRNEDRPVFELELSMPLAEGRNSSGPLPECFDVWTSTEEDVQRWLLCGALLPDHPALAQWASAQHIQRNRQRIETGGVALLEAVSHVAKQGLVMPKWMADIYLSKFLKIQRLEVGTLDEAFGHAPIKRLASLRQRRKLVPLISKLLIEAINADVDRPIDKSLFEEIGAMPGIGKSGTFVEEVYREGVREHGIQDLRQLKAFKKPPFK